RFSRDWSSDVCSSDLEAISRPAHGLDQTAVIGEIGLQSLAKTSYMHVDRAFFDVDITAPDMVEQLAARIGPLLVRHEELQQLELRRPHIDRLLLDEDTVAGRIQSQPLHLNRAFVFQRSAA